jgi:hypothetical protein
MMTMAMSDDETILNAHYAGRNLEVGILAGLRAAGKDNDQLTPDDLAAAWEARRAHWRRNSLAV